MTRDTREARGARGAREGAAGAPPPFSDEELTWVRAHMTQLRESIFGQRLVLQSLLIGLVLGLAAYVGGYVLKASVTTEPLKLGADLLYALGWALWTGVVVALFVEVIPRAKRRQIKRALDAYEAVLRGRRPDPEAPRPPEKMEGEGREWRVTLHAGSSPMDARDPLPCLCPGGARDAVR